MNSRYKEEKFDEKNEKTWNIGGDSRGFKCKKLSLKLTEFKDNSEPVLDLCINGKTIISSSIYNNPVMYEDSLIEAVNEFKKSLDNRNKEQKEKEDISNNINNNHLQNYVDTYSEKGFKSKVALDISKRMKYLVGINHKNKCGFCNESLDKELTVCDYCGKYVTRVGFCEVVLKNNAKLVKEACTIRYLLKQN